MHYYEVLLATNKKLVNSTLTYCSLAAASTHQIVSVPLVNKTVPGVVVKTVSKPAFNTKEILEIIDIALPPTLIELAAKVSDYYGTTPAQSLALVLPSGLAKSHRARPTATSVGSIELQDLTLDQKMAISSIAKTPSGSTTLLHGDTGTGKTRVYVHLARAAVQSGKGAIILTPEIGLTSPLADEFRKVFGEVFVIHSRLSEAERHLLWFKILVSPSPIVIGPRSAIFAPIKNLGLIVVDEAHEQSYKQDTQPKYSALRVAKLRASIDKAKLVLGSATPLVEDMYLAQELGANIVTMKEPAANFAQPVNIKVVDLSEAGNRGKIISSELAKSIEESLTAHQQSLIFHNRRGTATTVLCESCGHIEMCDNCLLPLTFHRDQKNLRCHICGYHRQAKISCPSCGKASLKFTGYGTKQIETEVSRLFPMAKVIRFDSDSSVAGSLQKLYSSLRDNKYDIIVGTQMIAKGLDLPHLRTVGIVHADSLLYLPDYSSTERFFQLIYQVIGRVGRHQPGEVVLQTYNPTSQTLLATLKRDYQAFYEAEIAERRNAKYPPFSYLLSLVCARKDAAVGLGAAEQLAGQLRTNKKIRVLGPAPAFHEKSAQGWRWQIVVKTAHRQELLKIMTDLPPRWQATIDPYNLLS